MPIISKQTNVKSSKVSLKKVTISPQTPAIKTYLKDNTSKNTCADSHHANLSCSDVSQHPPVESVMKPLETQYSTSEGFSVSDTNSSTERRIPEVPTFECKIEEEEENKINKDFDMGEPLRFQHLTIDFTPIKGVDDDKHLQQKCIDFWEFVNAEPWLKNIMAVPVKKHSYKHIDEVLHNVENVNHLNVPEVKTALDWAQNIPLNYLGKLSYKYCPEPSPSYHYNSQKSSETSDSSSFCSKSSTWTIKHKKDKQAKLPKSASLRAEEETKRLCAEMEDFDRKHLRCLDPPVRPPTLITAKMQKFLPSLSCAPLSAD